MRLHPFLKAKQGKSLENTSIFAQALEFEAGQRNWQLQQDALHTAASVKLRQQVAASQAAVEAQRTNQLADWAAEEQEQALKKHQASAPQPQALMPACTAVASLVGSLVMCQLV